MTLLEPTIGEVLDRMAIVSLKLLHGGGEHFKAEHVGLTKRFHELWDVGHLTEEEFSTLQIALDQLVAVNTKLWDATEEQTQAAQGRFEQSESDAACLLQRIHHLNKKRVRLREEIDKLLGQYKGPEKVGL